MLKGQKYIKLTTLDGVDPGHFVVKSQGMGGVTVQNITGYGLMTPKTQALHIETILSIFVSISYNLNLIFVVPIVYPRPHNITCFF